MEERKISELKKDEFFKRKEGAGRVFIKGDYDRASKSYSCIAYDDINHEIFIKAYKKVIVGFTF